MSCGGRPRVQGLLPKFSNVKIRNLLPAMLVPVFNIGLRPPYDDSIVDIWSTTTTKTPMVVGVHKTVDAAVANYPRRRILRKDPWTFLSTSFAPSAIRYSARWFEWALPALIFKSPFSSLTKSTGPSVFPPLVRQSVSCRYLSLRGAHTFEPCRRCALQPGEPFFRDDANDVRVILLSSPRAQLHL